MSGHWRLQQRYLNQDLKPQIYEILENDITLDEKEAADNRSTVESTVNSLVRAMKKEDELFKSLYRRTVYVGSYYDGTRVKNATEFDVNVVIDLPFSRKDVEIRECHRAPGYVEYQLDENVPIEDPTLDSFFYRDGKLLKPEVHQWLKQTMMISVASYWMELPRNVKKITETDHGPACTFKIIPKSRREEEIDVDVVFVINGMKYKRPQEIYTSELFNELETKDKVWFLVPKPHGRVGGLSGDTLWRITFPLAERELLNRSGGCIKYLIQLLKNFCTIRQWKDISSHHIKTLFLLETDRRQAWPLRNLGILLITMLRKLKTAVKTRELPYYFDRDDNMLADMDPNTSETIADEIEDTIIDIKENPDDIQQYFSNSQQLLTTSHGKNGNHFDYQYYYPYVGIVGNRNF